MPASYRRPLHEKSADSRAIRARCSVCSGKNAQLLCLKLFRILSSTLPREPLLHMSSIGVQHIMQHVHMIQHRTGTLGHAVQRILRNMHINTGLALDQLIQTAQQSAAAGQGNAAVDDIRTQLRRGAL